MFADAQKKGLLYFGDEQNTKEEFLNWFEIRLGSMVFDLEKSNIVKEKI
jgi:hypothetical protein